MKSFVFTLSRSAVEEKCTVRRAADRLTLSPRRIKQLKKEFTLRGASAIISVLHEHGWLAFGEHVAQFYMDIRKKALEAVEELMDFLEERYPEAMGILDNAKDDILAVYDLPAHYRKKMRTTNMMERTNKEIWRRNRNERKRPQRNNQ